MAKSTKITLTHATATHAEASNFSDGINLGNIIFGPATGPEGPPATTTGTAAKKTGGGTTHVSSALEQIVRAFVRVDSKLPDPPRPAPPPLPGSDAEATIVWGGTSDFNVITPPDQPVEDAIADGLAASSGGGGGGGGGGGHARKQKKKKQDEKPGVRSYDMIDAKWQEIKVYNPDDKEQWVKVRRYTSIRFRGPEDEIVKFNIAYDKAPDAPA